MICPRESRSPERPPSSFGVRVAVRPAQATPTLTAHIPVSSGGPCMPSNDKDPASIPSGGGEGFPSWQSQQPKRNHLAHHPVRVGLWQSHTSTTALTSSQHHPPAHQLPPPLHSPLPRIRRRPPLNAAQSPEESSFKLHFVVASLHRTPSGKLKLHRGALTLWPAEGGRVKNTSSPHRGITRSHFLRAEISKESTLSNGILAQVIGVVVGTSEPGTGTVGASLSKTEATCSNNGIHLAWRRWKPTVLVFLLPPYNLPFPARCPASSRPQDYDGVDLLRKKQDWLKRSRPQLYEGVDSEIGLFLSRRWSRPQTSKGVDLLRKWLIRLKQRQPQECEGVNSEFPIIDSSVVFSGSLNLRASFFRNPGLSSPLYVIETAFFFRLRRSGLPTSLKSCLSLMSRSCVSSSSDNFAYAIFAVSTPYGLGFFRT
ncbi:hypothetical protein Taro_015463, partial [Colocasia esculenta]|nr:hypothetical protein [Colocasia esculenta]